MEQGISWRFERDILVENHKGISSFSTTCFFFPSFFPKIVKSAVYLLLQFTRLRILDLVHYELSISPCGQNDLINRERNIQLNWCYVAGQMTSWIRVLLSRIIHTRRETIGLPDFIKNKNAFECRFWELLMMERQVHIHLAQGLQNINFEHRQLGCSFILQNGAHFGFSIFGIYHTSYGKPLSSIPLLYVTGSLVRWFEKFLNDHVEKLALFKPEMIMENIWRLIDLYYHRDSERNTDRFITTILNVQKEIIRTNKFDVGQKVGSVVRNSLNPSPLYDTIKSSDRDPDSLEPYLQGHNMRRYLRFPVFILCHKKPFFSF